MVGFTHRLHYSRRAPNHQSSLDATLSGIEPIISCSSSSYPFHYTDWEDIPAPIFKRHIYQSIQFVSPIKCITLIAYEFNCAPKVLECMRVFNLLFIEIIKKKILNIWPNQCSDWILTPSVHTSRKEKLFFGTKYKNSLSIMLRQDSFRIWLCDNYFQNFCTWFSFCVIINVTFIPVASSTYKIR